MGSGGDMGTGEWIGLVLIMTSNDEDAAERKKDLERLSHAYRFWYSGTTVWVPDQPKRFSHILERDGVRHEAIFIIIIFNLLGLNCWD